MEFKKGQELSWIHGEHHRIATVLEATEDKVHLSGETSDYWISKKALTAKIQRSERSYNLSRAC
ncbi:hypothetical protein [Vibrio owensii]|uniref:hypothetical protein n=1 Tax=Vibrio harveyi group TaxID=717610 RepID=UPI003CC5ECF5